jgi:drug/metabolite transporter (DMT)-like permease
MIPLARNRLDAGGPTAGFLFLGTVVIAWGLTWPVNKVVLASVPPLWAVTLRSVIATVALFVLALLLGRLVVPHRGDLPVLFSVTLLHMVGFTTLTSFGLTVVPAGRSVVLAYTTPLWVTPGARFFLGEQLSARRAIGVVIGLFGLVLLFNPAALDWSRRDVVLGNVAILLAALLWAGSIVHIRGHRWRSTTFALLPWQTLLATVILVVASLAFEGVPDVTWTPQLVSLLLYGGIPGTALPYWAIAMATQRLPAVTISLGLLATPVFSVVVSTLWLHETVTVSLAVALALILGGIAIGVTAGPRRTHAPSVTKVATRTRFSPRRRC